jgi:hypothetical protein
MTTQAIVHAYFDALEDGKLEDLLSLFAENAVVHSPLYGKKPALDFYPALLADSRSSRIEPLHLLHGPGVPKATVSFLYHWTLNDGETVTFECTNVFYFNEANKITELEIVYDASETRLALEQSQNS